MAGMGHQPPRSANNDRAVWLPGCAGTTAVACLLATAPTIGRHCEEQRDEAIQTSRRGQTRLLPPTPLGFGGQVAFARNDGGESSACMSCVNCPSCTFALAFSGKSERASPRSAATRGTYRDRHGRWLRDAMAALCCQTNGLMRTAKSCGPGAPGLASSWR